MDRKTGLVDISNITRERGEPPTPKRRYTPKSEETDPEEGDTTPGGGTATPFEDILAGTEKKTEPSEEDEESAVPMTPEQQAELERLAKDENSGGKTPSKTPTTPESKPGDTVTAIENPAGTPITLNLKVLQIDNVGGKWTVVTHVAGTSRLVEVATVEGWDRKDIENYSAHFRNNISPIVVTDPKSGISTTLFELDEAALQTIADKVALKKADDDVPFLRVAQASAVDNLVKDFKVLDQSEEIEMALKMRPLEVIESQILLNSLDGKAMAQLTEHGKVLLSKLASPGAIFHETFHDVSLYILSPRDSQLLYKKVREIPGQTVTYKGETKNFSELTDKEAEEWAAEEFRKYVLMGDKFKFAEGTSEDTRSFLRKIFDNIKLALRRLLGLNEAFEYDSDVSSIEGLFSDIKDGKFLKATRHSGRPNAGPMNLLAGIEGYNDVYARDFNLSLSGYLGKYFEEPFEAMGEENILDMGMFVSKAKAADPYNKRILTRAYRQAFEDMRQSLIARYGEIEDELDAYEKTLDDPSGFAAARGQGWRNPEQLAIDSTLDLIGRVSGEKRGTENLLIAEHYKYLQKLGLQIEEQAPEEEDRMSRDYASDTSHLEISPSKTASGVIKLMLGTITDPTDVGVTGLPKAYDMSTVLKTLQNELAGEMTWTAQLEKLQEMSENPKFPWAQAVIDRFDISLDGKSVDQVAIRTLFVTHMAQTHATPGVTNVELNNAIYGEDPGKERVRGKIKLNWTSNLKQLALSNDAKYVELKEGKIKFNPNTSFKLQVSEDGFVNTKLSSLESRTRNARTAENLMYLYKVLGIEFSDEQSALAEIEENFEDYREDLQYIFSDISKSKETLVNIFDRGIATSVSRANKLVNIELKTLSQTEFQYLNSAGNMEYSIMKNHLVSAISNFEYTELEEYYSPKAYAYGQGSLAIESWRLGNKPELVNIAGLSPATIGVTGAKIGNLKINDITVMHIDNILRGITIIPRAADKGTEFGVRFPIDFPTTINAGMETMVEYLKSEIAATAVGVEDGKHIKSYKDQIKTLRIFRSIVNESSDAVDALLKSKSKLNKIRKEIRSSEDGTSDTLEAFIELNRDAIENDIRSQLNADTDSMMSFLEESELMTEKNEFGRRNIYGISSELFKDSEGIPSNEASDTDIRKVVEEVVVRQFVGKNEVFRMYLNDPAFYTDLFKRISGAVSPKTLVDASQDLIDYLNEDQRLHRTDGKIDLLAIDEPLSKLSPELLASYDRIISDPEVREAYRKEIEKADGILAVDLPTFRLLKNGVGQWTPEMQAVYEREMKLLDDMRRGKVFREGDVLNIEGGAFPVDKFQYMGPFISGEDAKAAIGFLKMSIMPVFPSLAYVNGLEYTNILKMLDVMDKNSVGGLAIPSAIKVGATAKEHLVSYATTTGEMDFTRPEDIDPNARLTYDLRFFGSQIEISPYNKGKVTRGTQHAVQVSSDLYSEGQPIATEKDTVDKNGNRVSYAERLDREHNDIIGGFTRRGIRKTLKDLKIEEVEVEGVEGYAMSEESYQALLDIIIEEADKNDVGKAILEGAEYLKEKGGAFKFDYFVDRYRMETMVFSMLGKRVIKKKLVGEGLVQAPELGYEVAKTRTGRTVENGKLRFYENPEGKWEMEVFLPHQFKELIGQNVAVGREGDIIVDGVVMKGTSTLLDMIGIRIPTDGIHSVEIIKVKGFLPQSAGPRVVVPAGLVTKAGSDFDIDKLLMYFKSYRYTEEGIMEPVKFHTSKREWFQAQQNMFQRKLEDFLGRGATTEQAINALAEIFKTSTDLQTIDIKNMFEFDIETQVDLTAGLKDLTREEVEVMYEELIEAASEFFNISEEEGIGEISKKEFEQWEKENPGLNIYDVNSDGALQNRYMEISKELLSIKERATEFLRPVNTDDNLELAAKIQELYGEQGNYSLPDLSKVSDFHLETTLPNLMRVTEAFLQGAKVVGISALASTHQIKGQRADLRLNLNHRYELPYEERIFAPVRIHFEGFEVEENEDGEVDYTLSLGRITDIRGEKRISDAISQLVNTSVDIVKNPILHILNLGPDLAPAGLVLLRAGVPLKSVVYFMNQPIVRQYMTSKARSGSRLNGAIQNRKFDNAILSGLQDEYATEIDRENTYFADETLEGMIGKTVENLSPQEKAYQLSILEDLLVYLQLGDDMTSLIAAQSFDTKIVKSRANMEILQAQYETVMAKGIFPNAERITEDENTFMSDMKEYNFMATDILKDAFVATEDLPVYWDAYTMKVKELTHPKERMPLDDKLRVLEKFDQFLVSFILHNMPQSNGEKINNYSSRLLYGNNTFAQEVLKITRSKSHPLRNNIFLKSLIPVVQEVRVPVEGQELMNDFVEPEFKAMNVYDADALYDSFMEIVEYDSKNNTRIAKDTIYTALLQAGTMNTPFSFLDKIPGDIFARMAEDIFGVMMNAPDSVRLNTEALLEEFHKNMVNDNNVVQYVTRKSPKKERLMFTRELDKRPSTLRRVGAAREKNKYILTANFVVTDSDPDVESDFGVRMTESHELDTTGYTSRNYLNTTSRRMTIRRIVEEENNDPTENC
jgi:hypothetical protein